MIHIMIEQGKCGNCEWFIREREMPILERGIVSDLTEIVAQQAGDSGGSVMPFYGHCTVYGNAIFGKMSNWPCSEWRADIDGVRIYLFEPKTR